MWTERDRRFVWAVLFLTFVGNVLAILGSYMFAAYDSYLGLDMGWQYFMKWPWFLVALATTAANFMYAHVALVNARLSPDKYGIDILGYLTVLGIVLAVGFYPGRKALELASDGALMNVGFMYFVINWCSVTALRRRLSKRIWDLALDLYEHGKLEEAAKFLAEENGQ